MRHSYFVAMTFAVSIICSGVAARADALSVSTTLPAKLLDARGRYESAIARANADYQRSVDAASKIYEVVLDRAVKDATKAGDFDGAIAVKAEIQTVESRTEEAAQRTASSAGAPKPASTDEFETHVFHGKNGKTLPYRLLKPARVEKGKKYPLVLFFHGYGERGTDNNAQLKNNVGAFLKPDVREKYPCFVLVPQAPGAWIGVSDFKRPLPAAMASSDALQLSIEMLNAAENELPVDADRIYLSGRSNGGYAVWYLLEHAPARFAAAVPMCGGGDPSNIAAARGVSIWDFHGDNDPTVPVDRSREMIAALKLAGAHPKYSEYPGLNHSEAPDKAYKEPELLPWLFDQRRSVR